MKFGSWTYNGEEIDLHVFNNETEAKASPGIRLYANKTYFSGGTPDRKHRVEIGKNRGKKERNILRLLFRTVSWYFVYVRYEQEITVV